jgi:hypothetical protein
MAIATQTLNSKKSLARKSSASRVRKDRIRTTVSLSPEAAAIVDRLKAISGVSTSAAVEELIFRSQPQESWLVEENGILVIHAPVKEGKLSDESVRKMLEELPF